MDSKEILQYAIKGLGVEIAEIEQKIDKGYNVIDRINKGQQTNTTKSKTEILETIEKYRQKRDELQQKRDNLLFDEMMAETTETITE